MHRSGAIPKPSRGVRTITKNPRPRALALNDYLTPWTHLVTCGQSGDALQAKIPIEEGAVQAP